MVGFSQNFIEFTGNDQKFMNSQYKIIYSNQLNDPEWDNFINESSVGHYTHLSSWAAAKKHLGWQVNRILIKNNGTLIAGAQLFYKSLHPSILGTFGYIPKGPVFLDSKPDDKLICQVMEAIKKICRTKFIQFLAIQPPDTGFYLIDTFIKCGCRKIPDENITPPGTALTDLSLDIDTIFSKFKSQTRQKIRLSQKVGVVVREGCENDLPIFNAFFQDTAKRQNFICESYEYILAVWRELIKSKSITLLIAEYQNNPVSALLLICFGKTATAWRCGWCGKYGNTHSNEALHWAAIQWSKAHDYNYYDIGGLPCEVVKEIIRHKDLPENCKNTVSSFKLKFSTNIVLYPETYMYISNPIFRWSYLSFFPIVEKIPFFQNKINTIRNQQ